MKTVLQATKANNRRETLVALRDRIAATIDNCESGRDMAALSKRLVEVMNEIESLPDPNKGKNPAQIARQRMAERGSS